MDQDLLPRIVGWANREGAQPDTLIVYGDSASHGEFVLDNWKDNRKTLSDSFRVTVGHSHRDQTRTRFILES